MNKGYQEAIAVIDAAIKNMTLGHDKVKSSLSNKSLFGISADDPSWLIARENEKNYGDTLKNLRKERNKIRRKAKSEP